MAHVPALVVNVLPTTAWPLITGRATFLGLTAIATSVVAARPLGAGVRTGAEAKIGSAIAVVVYAAKTANDSTKAQHKDARCTRCVELEW